LVILTVENALPEALGQSDAFLKVQECISQVAQVNRPVLIIGERGTGKELAASRLHYLSKRWQNPFVTLNCAALNPSVLESELFGHEAGAFTGAIRQRKGRFEMAQDGTLFLDEIGNMPMIVQEKILRVIEYGSFERVGGSSPVTVDVRIIAATNADLPSIVKRGQFKADLLDRLSFEVILLPALRDRTGDIPLLARHFAAQMSIELGIGTPPAFSDNVLAQLASYHWPGNIRELKNAVERAVYRNGTGCIDAITIDPFDQVTLSHPGESVCPDRRGEPVTPPSLPPASGSNLMALPLAQPLPRLIDSLEQSYLEQALEKAHFSQRKAAGYLGISYHQLRGLYRKHLSKKG
jgi:psp operon transcriptional activator